MILILIYSGKKYLIGYILKIATMRLPSEDKVSESHMRNGIANKL